MRRITKLEANETFNDEAVSLQIINAEYYFLLFCIVLDLRKSRFLHLNTNIVIRRFKRFLPPILFMYSYHAVTNLYQNLLTTTFSFSVDPSVIR